MENHQQFSLKWNNYLQHISGAFDSLRTSEDFVDVTLSCEGKKIKAHKMLLSACSNYFREIFKDNQCAHPVIVFHNIKFEDLSGLVTFMYQGQVNVEQECLQSFLNTAELLEVQGLTSPSNKNIKAEDEDESVSDVSSGGGKAASPQSKRKRSKVIEESDTLAEPGEESVQNDELPVQDDDGEDSIPQPAQFLLHHDNSLTQDNSDTYTDSQYYQPGKEEPPDISASIDPSGSSNDYQESLQDVGEQKGYSLDSSTDTANPSNPLPFPGPVPVSLVYLCKICGKKFKHAGSLSMHKRLHSGDTHCSICGKVFSRRYYLKVHMLIHHKTEIDQIQPQYSAELESE